MQRLNGQVLRRSEMAADSTPAAISLPFLLPPLPTCQVALPSSSGKWRGHYPLESAQTRRLASASRAASYGGSSYTPSSGRGAGSVTCPADETKPTSVSPVPMRKRDVSGFLGSLLCSGMMSDKG